MKNCTKKLLIFLLVVLVATSVMAFAACTTSVNGTYYYWNYNRLDKTQYYTLKNGRWTNESGESGDYELNSTSITLYVEFFGSREEFLSGTLNDGVLILNGLGTMYFYKNGKQPQSGTIISGGNQQTKNKYTVTYDANGGSFADGLTFTQNVEDGSKLTAPTSPTRKNYSFAGWAKNKSGSNMWKFDEDTVTADTTLYAQWTQETAVILSVDGASIDGTNIYMFVKHDVDSVSLSSKVVCSDDSIWRLYYDRMGQVEIPTKVAAGMSGYLSSGENQFYIVVSSQNGAQVNLYELTVYRSYAINVNYYDGNTLLNTETAYTGVEFSTNYRPNITGYTFNSWKDADGNKFTSDTLWKTTALYADKTANTYTAYLDVNGGNSLDQTTQTMTYDKSYSFPVPTRTGYSFAGWYVGNTQITNTNGRSLTNWDYASTTTVTAHWQAHNYKLTLSTNNYNAGTVTGAGTYVFDSKVTITAETNNGYTWVGWFDENTKLSDELSFTYTMGFDKTLTARWIECPVFLEKNIDGAGMVSGVEGATAIGKQVTVTATTYIGYNFIGWYYGNTKLTDQLEYTFVMPSDETTYMAKWEINPEMANFEFVSTTTTCLITNVIDKTIVELNVPSYVTDMQKGGRYTYNGAFIGCEFITSISLPFIDTELGEYFAPESIPSGYSLANYVPETLSQVKITGGTVICKNAFYLCSNITTVDLPSTITRIEMNAFRGAGISNIHIYDSITYIGIWAFSSCNNLVNAYFENPNGWRSKQFDSSTTSTSLSASDLSNQTTAANYLRNASEIWYRT